MHMPGNSMYLCLNIIYSSHLLGSLFFINYYFNGSTFSTCILLLCQFVISIFQFFLLCYLYFIYCSAMTSLLPFPISN